MRAVAASLAGVVLAHGPASAQEPAPPPATQGPDLPYDLRIDVPVVAVGGLGWILSEAVFKRALAPAACRWCDRDANGADALNPIDAGVRAALHFSGIALPDLLSNISAYGVVPLATVGMAALAAGQEDRLGGVPVDALVVAEAVVLAADLNQVTKFLVGRERPFVHFQHESALFDRADDNVSFYSGHSSFGFSLAVAAGTVSTLRGYRWAPWVWAAGLTAAAATAYLRLAADKHYFTDVLVGSLVGAAVGWAVPYLLHRVRAVSAG